ncbi:LOW QUALITY PROTEIN: HHIP-like protein 2 [Parus major]|uniref:LOW QUALITY PROTEIN: HHIP-like protein 2 n=1 Tax=Parus major TaxID=9157 RepID=UPI001443DE68|nr:LOW QUALITY PROTEIN: HHIP-like protein 2 [Parus major]
MSSPGARTIMLQSATLGQAINKTEKINEPCYEEVQDFYTSDLKKPMLKEVNAWPQAGKSSSSSGVSYPCPHMCVCLSLLCLTLLGHPQCLDYGLPFQPPLPLELCSTYENLGCCDQERDNSIAAKYWDIMDYMDSQGSKLHGTSIKDILCQYGEKPLGTAVSKENYLLVKFGIRISILSELYFMSTSYPSAYAPHGLLYKLIDPARRAPPGKCKHNPVPVKTKSKRIPFVPRAKTVLELLNEPSTTVPPKSSILTAATPRDSSKKAKKTPSIKIKESKRKQLHLVKRVKAEAKPHKGKKIGQNSRTAPAPPLPKKKSSHLTRTEEFLPKKPALAKGKVEKEEAVFEAQ